MKGKERMMILIKRFTLSFLCTLLVASLFVDTMDARQVGSLPGLAEQYPELVFVRGDGASNQIALTFDDGPDPRFTDTVLNALEEFDVPATFFVLGQRAEANPDYVSRIVDEGHDIANHTYSHADLADLTVDEMEQEIDQADAVIENIVGFRPRLFRPPFGSISEEDVVRLGEMNNVAIGWDVDPNDWQEIPADEVSERVIADTTAGSIILLHDGVDSPELTLNSPEALQTIIPELQSQGYEFVTVSELIGIENRK
ncbi:hypothetical protein DH09_19020 [Bacillaceae bacterium JMAK1]|nr:hypothetical protein DH09_19020 [Bacillaceae bacterium JMAK1]